MRTASSLRVRSPALNDTRFRIKEEESHVHIIKTDPKLQFARLTPSAPVSAELKSPFIRPIGLLSDAAEQQRNSSAHGSAFKGGGVIEPFENIHVYNVMARIHRLTTIPF